MATQLAGNEAVENLRLAWSGADMRAGDKEEGSRSIQEPKNSTIHFIVGVGTRLPWELGQLGYYSVGRGSIRSF